MRRRTLLQGALGLPLVADVGAASTHFNRAEAAGDTGVLFSGLAGLDYAVGGISAGELICVTSPPHSGKTLLLLDAGMESPPLRMQFSFSEGTVRRNTVARDAKCKICGGGAS